MATKFCLYLHVSNLDHIRETLKVLKPELAAKYHVSAMGVFGSAVRGDFNETSDVDIIVDFSKPIGIEFVDLADLIEQKLQKRVDLVSRNGLKQKYYHAIESEIVYV